MDLWIYGYFGRGNLGDEALARVWREGLSGLGRVRPISPPRLPRAGVTVFTGEPLQDRTSRRSFLFYAAAIQGAKRRGRAVLGAVGVDVRSRLSLALLPHILHGVDYISVRDPRSREILRSRGIEAREARDVALLLPAPRGRSGGPVLLNLVPALPAAVRRGATGLARHAAAALGKELRGFVMDRKEDVAALRGIPLLVPRSVEEALNMVASATLLIGARLHSLEFALLCGTPFVAVPYAPKVLSFLDLVERDLPEGIPRIPAGGDAATWRRVFEPEHLRALRRARERLREEAKGGMKDVLRFIRGLA
ncbi:polysaccharide pyruvyl transferase family protein [Candidatus Bipolaricaulota sp. J31]